MAVRGKPLHGLLDAAGQYLDLPGGTQARNERTEQPGGRNLVLDDGNTESIHGSGVFSR